MTCICGHHEHAHAQDVGLCGSPHGCDCNRFVEAKPEVPVPKPFAEMTGAELRDFLLNQRGTQEQAYAALRDAIRAEAIAERAPMEDTITALRARAERAEQERDENKAVQDAMWLAGSEADTAERNLARAYIVKCEQVATLTAERDAWEVACHNATIEKHEQVALLRAPVPSVVTEEHAAACVRFVEALTNRKFDVRYLGANSDGELNNPWRVQGVAFNGFAHGPTPLAALAAAEQGERNG